MKRSAGVLLLCIGLFFSLTLACTSSDTEDKAEPPSEPPAAPTSPPPVAKEAPTATPTIGSMPSPTDTRIPPPPTPTTKPERALEIYGGYTYKLRDYYHIVGEMFNSTDDWLEYVRIVATFYDASGTMIGSDFAYTELDVIPPGDRGVFDLGVDASTVGGDVASYDLQVQGRPPLNIPYQGLVVEVSNQYEQRDYWHLEGLVRNAGGSDCEYVRVVAGFYDSTDNIVGVSFTYTKIDVVAAGSQAPFDLGAENLPQWDHFRVWVQGRPLG